MGRLAATIAALATAGALAGSAGADGLPVGGVEVGPAGVAKPGAAVRYVALHAGRDTLVARVEQDGGRVLGAKLLTGRFTIPAVALDGTAAGLSADGRTLVLIRPRARFPQRETAFAVLDAERLRLRDRIRLAGDFSFDALSPDGRLLYLIQYVDRKDPTRYQVRGYDLADGRLLPDPIVDPRTFGDVMRGYPVTRVMSSDGRFAYTLYDGGGGIPFVHALDTADGTAACIALDALAGRDDLMDVRLALGGGGLLRVVARGEAVAEIDTRTYAVAEPSLESPAPAAAAAGDGGGDGPTLAWAVLAGVLAGLAAALVAVVRRRRRARPASEAGPAAPGGLPPSRILVPSGSGLVLTEPPDRPNGDRAAAPELVAD